MKNHVFIIGSPRSGTSWIAKMFDAHPRVLYRHEPDSSFPNRQIPGIVPSDEVEQYLPQAKEYLEHLYAISSIKTSTSRPAFSKDYRGTVGSILNSGTLLVLRTLEVIKPIARRVNRIQVPDFIGPERKDECYVVAKSVAALGRAELYARACPDSRFIVIMRHPAGFVASQLRGIRLGRLDGEVPKRALSQSDGAERRGITYEAFQAMSDIERLCWYWVLLNEHMFAGIQGLENCMVVQYERVCAEPIVWARRMYEHANIPFPDQASRFLNASQAGRAREKEFFSVFRDPVESAQKWRKELDAGQIEVVRSIINNSEVGAMFTF